MISVVITTYNGEKFINDQLDSIFNQSLLPSEILICDDNSSDSTLKLIFKYLQNKNIKYYYNDEGYIKDEDSTIVRVFKNEKNIGYNLNFINLIKKTSYDIVFISDQDDIWYKDKIKIQYDLLNLKSANLVASDYDLINTNKILNHKTAYKEIRIKNISHVSFYGMTMCFKKDNDFIDSLDYLLKNNSFYYYDRLFSLYFIIKGKVYYINDALVYHRIHNDNAVGNNTSKIRGSLLNRVNIAKDYYNDICIIKNYFNNIDKYKLYYLNINEKFRFKRYILLKNLYENNNLYNKIKLLFFILINFYKYPYIKSIFGDIYYILK